MSKACLTIANQAQAPLMMSSIKHKETNMAVKDKPTQQEDRYPNSHIDR